MALTSGTRLGPYEIESPLGAGGMGEVYRARDTRLERTVAIKVLNAQLVASAELRARFEREAKIISQLQHPNICVLHDVGNEGAIDYLVMEFLQGESLAERLRKGPLAAEEVLRIAIEIADALEKAHRAGVAVRSQLKKWLVPYVGSCAMREVGGQTVQMFVQRCSLAPKSCHNLVLTLRMMWSCARAWGYVSHDPFEGLVLPKIARQAQFFFTLDEIQRIIAAASGPLKSFYWLAAETGMRAGELCGLRIDDMDLEQCVINVKPTVWRGRIQTPKTVNSIRQFAISPKLASHLRAYLSTWRPNLLNLVFATKNGTPWDQNLVVKRKLHPLLKSLGIRRCGLHAFRHTNGSLMDRLNAPMKIRQERFGPAPGSNLTLGIYTHTVEEDDRRVAEQLGEMLCPNVPSWHKRKPSQRAKAW